MVLDSVDTSISVNNIYVTNSLVSRQVVVIYNGPYQPAELDSIYIENIRIENTELFVSDGSMILTNVHLSNFGTIHAIAMASELAIENIILIDVQAELFTQAFGISANNVTVLNCVFRDYMFFLHSGDSITLNEIRIDNSTFSAMIEILPSAASSFMMDNLEISNVMFGSLISANLGPAVGIPLFANITNTNIYNSVFINHFINTADQTDIFNETTLIMNNVTISEVFMSVSFLELFKANIMIENCNFEFIEEAQELVSLFWLDRSTIVLRGNDFNAITAGSIFIASDSMITDTNSNYENNQFQSGVFVLTTTVMVADNLTISNNNQTGQSNSFFTIKYSKLIATNLRTENNNGSIGGVIACYERSLINLSECSFHGDRGSYGGSIYVTDFCDLIIRNSTFEGCYATSTGGGIVLAGSAYSNIEYCNFTGNSALGSGGAIAALESSVMNFNQLIISNNQALSGGGLVIDDFATGNISNIVFSKCSAKTSGGAIMASGYSTPVITNCIIQESVANSYGSGFFGNAFTTPYLADVVLMNNYSPNEGGGMYLSDHANVTLHSVTFHNNIARASGGGLTLAVNASVTSHDCLFVNNSCGSRGGAVAVVNHGIPIFTLSHFEGNAATSGGAIYFADNSEGILQNCNITGNFGNSLGGGIYTSGASKAYLNNSYILSNQAKLGPGGGLYVQDFSYVEIYSTTIQDNRGTYGGGVYCVAAFSIVSSNCSIINNTAIYSGGGIFTGEEAITSWTDLLCEGNLATKRDGGCIVAEGTATIILQSSTIMGNSAVVGYGGGVALIEYTTGNFTSCVIETNSASQGGGIYTDSTAQFYINDTNLLFNTAQTAGGAILISGGSPFVENSYFAFNAAEQGGGLFVAYDTNAASTQFAKSCIFQQNYADIGGGIFMQEAFNSNTSNSRVMDNENCDIIKDLSIPASFTFENIILQFNVAENGGAVYIDTIGTFTPTFGPTVYFDSNTAQQFGGAILIGTTSTTMEYTMYNASFIGNLGEYAGSNVAYFELQNVQNFDKFCLSCDYGNATNGGYETPEGFATPPRRLGFNSTYDPCPGSITIDAPPLSIAVFLYDEFETTVQGKFLEDNVLYVQLHESDSQIAVHVSNSTQLINSTSGAALFDDVTFTGSNNSTSMLKFDMYSSANPFSIEGTSCSLLIYGCSDGLTYDESSNSCVQQKDLSPVTIILILLGIIILLTFILCLIGIVSAAIQYKKQKEALRIASIEIPDFEGKPVLTLEDILQDPAIPRLEWEDITIVATIGKGASGLVSRGIWKKNGVNMEIALKELIFGFQVFGIEAYQDFLVEIKLMSALQHDHIVKLLGICATPDMEKLYLVIELCHHGSVKDLLIKKRGNIPLDMRLQFAKDAAKGVLYLHSKKLIHRDLKLANLLVNDKWTCKIADFGVSTVKPDVTRTMTCIGTPMYMAPEVLQKNKYSEKADVYSFGHILYELFSGEDSYSDPDHKDLHHAQLIYRIIHEHSRPSLDFLNPSLQQLIQDCWKRDPRLRPSFVEIIVRLRRLKEEFTEVDAARISQRGSIQFSANPVDSQPSKLTSESEMDVSFDYSLSEEDTS